MRLKSVKSSFYPSLPFHAIRLVSLLSALIVSIILAVFIYNLHQEGYKLPWAFLILIISAALSIANFTFTTVTHCCCGPSPRLSFTINILLLILWGISLGLLSWSVAHTILTPCTVTYWGTSTGISVCRTYKVLFACTVAGTASIVIAAWLDMIARRRQTKLGSYNPMESSTALGDIKLQGRDNAMMSGGIWHSDDPFNDAYDSAPQNRLRESHDSSGVTHGGDGADYYGAGQDSHQYPGYGAGSYGYAAYHGYSQVPETSYDAATYR